MIQETYFVPCYTCNVILTLLPRFFFFFFFLLFFWGGGDGGGGGGVGFRVDYTPKWSSRYVWVPESSLLYWAASRKAETKTWIKILSTSLAVVETFSRVFLFLFFCFCFFSVSPVCVLLKEEKKRSCIFAHVLYCLTEIYVMFNILSAVNFV